MHMLASYNTVEKFLNIPEGIFWSLNKLNSIVYMKTENSTDMEFLTHWLSGI